MNLRLALVGCGMMASRYATVFGEIPGIEIVACSDPTKEKLERFRSGNGIPEGFTDFTAMLDSVQPDAVLNVTFDPLHIPVLLACLRRKLPVLTEKPLGMNLDECLHLEEFPDSLRSRVAVNLSKRNAGAVRGAKDLVSAGVLGTLISVDASYRQGWVFTNHWGDWRTRNAWLWRMDSSFSPLGVFSDLGSHLLDLVTYISGSTPEYLSCNETAVIEKGEEEIRGHKLDSPDRMTVTGRLSSGAVIQLTTSRIDLDEIDRPRLTVRGSLGSLRIDLMDRRHSVELYSGKSAELPAYFNAGTEPGQWQTLPCPRPRNVYENFTAALHGESADYPGLDDAMKVQEALEAVRISKEDRGRKVHLDEVKS